MQFTLLYNQMSCKLLYTDCVAIQIYLREKLSHREIARKLDRSNSSISDEIRKYSMNGKYIASIAWIMRQTKRKLVNALHYKIQRWNPLDLFIVEKIKQYRSPEQIAWRWRKETWEIISKDTIYSHVKRNYPELIKKYFRRKGKQYKYGTTKAWYIYDRKSIRERPIEAKLKSELWHREWDTVWWANRKWWFVTFTERKSWYELAWVLEEKYATIVTETTRQLFQNLPNELKKTVTLDNWREFVEHYMWKWLCWLDTYFADVWNPWQRWLNENTNWLLRQFYPKKTRLSNISQQELDYYVSLLNNRPRKRNNYLTPTEVLKTYCADLK
jgi:IS30 family transposase